MLNCKLPAYMYMYNVHATFLEEEIVPMCFLIPDKQCKNNCSRACFNKCLLVKNTMHTSFFRLQTFAARCIQCNMNISFS